MGKGNSLVGNAMKILIPLVITVGLCIVMFRSIDYREMLAVIRDNCDFKWIASGLALTIVAHVLRAYRWKIQLRSISVTPPGWVLVLSIFGMYAVNLVFPRLGELWRSEYVARRQRADFSKVFGSMVAERLADLVCAFALLLLAFFMASHTIMEYVMQDNGMYTTLTAIVKSPWVWAALVLCCGAAWWLLTRKSAKGSILGKIQGFVKGVWQGFASIAMMQGKTRWLILTLAIWVCYFVQFYVACFAFPFTREALAHDGVAAALVPFVLSSVSMGVPSNGGIGPWQWAVMFGLSIYGVSRVDAGAFANLVLGCSTLLVIVCGIITFITIMLTKDRAAKPESENSNLNTYNNE